MAQKIKVQVDVDSESVSFATDRTLTLTEQVRLLRKELQTVPEGTKEWTILQQRYNETKDSLDRVNVKSKELFGTLGALPGPIGNVSSQLDNTIGTLKVFSQIKLSDIGGQFKEVGKDIVGIAKSFADLTGITKAYTVLNNALAASFIKVGVGEAAAATGARALSAALISTGVGALVVGLGMAVSALMDYFDASKKAEKAANDYSDAIKRQNEILEDNLGQIDFENKKKLLQAKIAGESEANLNKITQDGLQERLKVIKSANDAILAEQRQLALRQGKYAKMSDEERAALAEKNLEQMKKLGDQESKAREQIELNKLQVEADAAEKSRQNATKTGNSKAEEAKKQRESDIKELEKAEAHALLVVVSNKEKELGEVDLKYKELISKEEKYGRSTKILTDAREAEKKVIRDKYAQEEQDFIDNALAKSGDIIEANRKKELQGAEKAYKKLYDQKVLAHEDTKALDSAYATQVESINKNYDEQQLKQRQEFEDKVRSIKAKAIADDTESKIAAREAEYQKELAALEKDLEFIKLSEDKKNELRATLAKGKNIDEFKIKQDARLKDAQDELDLLHTQGEALIQGTKAYWDNRSAILEASRTAELEKTKVSEEATTEEKEKAEAKRTAIEEKYAKERKKLKEEEFLQTLNYISQGLEAAKGVANAILAVNKNKMDEELKAAGEDEAKKDEIRKKYFEKNKKTQIALAYINTFQSAVSAYASLAGIPVVGPALGAIAAAAAIVAGLMQVNAIKAQQYEGSSGSSGTTSTAPATQAQVAPAQAQVPAQEKSIVSNQASIGSIVGRSAGSPNVGSLVTPNAN